MEDAHADVFEAEAVDFPAGPSPTDFKDVSGIGQVEARAKANLILSEWQQRYDNA
jgi:hypothetical protein